MPPACRPAGKEPFATGSSVGCSGRRSSRPGRPKQRSQEKMATSAIWAQVDCSYLASLAETNGKLQDHRFIFDRRSLSSTPGAGLKKNCRVRICVIFNPTARGEKAKRFRRHLDTIAAECALKQTLAAGGARSLAAEAVNEGFQTIVAAGGDGTLNEVLNGIGDVEGGFARARLGALPLGTVTAFPR